MLVNEIERTFLSENITERAVLSEKTDKTSQEIAKKLIKNLEKSYNSSACPFAIIGTVVMAPHRDFFKEKIDGYPIAYLYGPSQSGKTNLLNTVAAFFGLKKSAIQSGAVTVNRIWNLVNKNSRFPVILDELLTNPYQKKYFDTLIKSVYDGKTRGRMKGSEDESLQYVNATLLFSSNFLPSEEDAVLNRLVFCSFDPNDFNPSKASEFNEIRDNYMSLLLPEILKMGEQELSELFEESKKEIQQWLLRSASERKLNNATVLLCGIKKLHNMSVTTISEQLESNLKKFIENYIYDVEVESALDKFLNFLPYLIDEQKLFSGRDYLIKDGILKVSFVLAYRHFSRFYRQVHSENAPTKKEIEAAAHLDKRVHKGKDQLTKSVTLGKKKRCLVVDITGNEELEAYECEVQSFSTEIEAIEENNEKLENFVNETLEKKGDK